MKNYKNRIFTVCVILCLCFCHLTFAKKAPEKPSYVQQQMILLGLYVYGINQELAKTAPDLGELQFLAESSLEIAQQTKTTKRGEQFHKDLSELVSKIETLQKLSQAKKRLESIAAAKDVMQSCSQCHTAGKPR